MKYAFSKLDNCYENRNLITNFDKEREPIFREAIKRFCWNGLTITDDAYWIDGTKDNTMSALRWKTDERRELSKFWDIVHSIENR